jgi:hypothetical protein
MNRSDRAAALGRLFVLLLAVGLAGPGCGGSAGDGGVADAPAGADVGRPGDGAPRETAGPSLSVRILEPAAGVVLPPEAVVELIAQVAWDGGPVQDLRAVWSSTAGGQLGVTSPDGTGRLFLGAVRLAGGRQAVSVSVTSDATGATARDTVDVVVRRRPSAPLVRLDPPEPTTTDPLVAIITQDSLVDDDVALVYTYRWRRDGAVATGQTTPTIAPHLTSKGETWEVAVTPGAGGVEGPLARATVVVRNTPPTLRAVRVLPSVATTDSTLDCTPEGAADADGDVVTFAYAWRVGAARVDGADGPRLTGEHFARGDRVVCQLTPSDGEADGATVASEPVLVANSEPWAEGVRVTPAAGATTTLFTCAVARSGDADDDPVTFRWSWWLDGAEQAGAVGTTWTPFGATRGQALVCAVRPDDGRDLGRLVTSAPVTLGNTPPTVDNVFVQPATGTARDTFACAPQDGRDADGDPLTFTFAWYVDDVQLPGADGATLDGLAAGLQRGDVLACEATPGDGFDAGAPERSKNSVRIGNSAPRLDAVAVEPGTGDVRTAFRCTATGWDDPDEGDAAVVRWRWYRNDAEVAGQVAETYGGPQAAFDALACEAVPYDGLDHGPALRSAAVVIVDLPPSVTSVRLTPAAPDRTTVLTCEPQGWSDPEGAAAGYRYAWQVNGALRAGADGATLAGDTLARGDVVLCRATPFDGVQEGAAVWSNPVAVGNAAPTVSAALLVPGLGNHNTTFTCAGEGAADPDDDTVFFLVEWFQHGERLVGRTSESVRITDYEQGDLLTCRLTPLDGLTHGAPVTSNPATLFDAQPSIASVTVTPTPAIVTDTLSCVPGGWSDPDDGEPTYRYAWLVNETAVPGAAGAELAPGPFRKHDQVVCRVTPSDGYLDGPPRSSAPVPVRNSVPTVGRAAVGGLAIDMALWFRCTAFDVIDLDQDAVTFTYRWFRNGEELPGARGQLLSGAGFALEETVQCEVTPNDGEEPGTPVRSNVLNVQNTPPEAEILQPRSLTLQLGSYVEFVGHVWDLEDRPEDLVVWWESHIDGLLDETPPDAAGLCGFATNGLSQGLHVITLRVQDSLLATGDDTVHFWVDPVCGNTGHRADAPADFWLEGFESGNLRPWSFANRKFVAANQYPYTMSRCENPREFLVDPAAARSGELGLLIQLPGSPADDVFSVAKAFPEPATIRGAYAECWVHVVDRVNLQFGFYHETPGTPEPTRHSAGAILRTSTTSFTYLPPGPTTATAVQRPSQPALPLGRWVKLSLSRDLDSARFQYFEDGAERYAAVLDDNRPPTGFSVGMSAEGGGVLGYVDDCTYLLVR